MYPEVASVRSGELAPQTTLNKFASEEEEWTLWEKLVISAKAGPAVVHIRTYCTKRKKEASTAAIVSKQ
jgi:hypothetical protein